MAETNILEKWAPLDASYFAWLYGNFGTVETDTNIVSSSLKQICAKGSHRVKRKKFVH